MKHILVFGDVILDEYIYGTVTRISPEAPIPVLSVSSHEIKIGGAGNVANNISALGSEVAGIFITGDDLDSEKMYSLFKKSQIKTDWIVSDKKSSTIKKTRVIGNRQQVVRLDYNDKYYMPDMIRDQIISEIDDAVNWADIVVISDYNKGTCTEVLCEVLIGSARKINKPVIVDPKGNNWEKYRGATVITPNMKEINTFMGENILNNNKEIEKAFYGLNKKLGVNYVLLTRSEKGMSLLGDDVILHIDAKQREVFDVSGAGDTVVATLAVTLNENVDNIKRAVNVANVAAGIVVGKPGTAIVTENELANELRGLELKIENKIYEEKNRKEFFNLINEWRINEETIVTTNGCFDILHKGHSQLLNKASKNADHLVVLVNADVSVKRLKGEKRPINNELDRAFLIASFGCVDAVVIFDPAIDNDECAEDMKALSDDLKKIALEAPMGILKRVNPDVHVKGGDYGVEQVPEAMYAKKFVSIPLVVGYSTTKTIDNARRNDN